MDKQNVQKEMEPIRLFYQRLTHTKTGFSDGQTFPQRFDPKLEFLELTRGKGDSFPKYKGVSIIWRRQPMNEKLAHTSESTQAGSAEGYACSRSIIVCPPSYKHFETFWAMGGDCSVALGNFLGASSQQTGIQPLYVP